MSFMNDYFGAKRQLPKRNYIKENIKRLQEISNAKKNDGASEKRDAYNRFSRTLSELNEISGPGYRMKREGSNLSLNQAKLKNTIDGFKGSLQPVGFRHQSCQTVAEKDIGSLYHDGVIRFPSRPATSFQTRGHTKMVRSMGLQTETPIKLEPPSVCEGSPAGDSIKDFVKINAMVQLNPVVLKKKPTVDPIRPPPNYQMGILPKYLREQKKEQDKLKDISVDPECPPGHAVLPDEQRVKHLEEIKQRYTELVAELNSIPVRTDTLRARKRRMAIEKELEKAEAGIKLFSRDKLFIQVPS